MPTALAATTAPRPIRVSPGPRGISAPRIEDRDVFNGDPFHGGLVERNVSVCAADRDLMVDRDVVADPSQWIDYGAHSAVLQTKTFSQLHFCGKSRP